jgi:hypothetical protein
MASQSVTLILDGTPTIVDYASALNGLADLLSAIAKRVVPDVDIAWEVETLDASSAVTTLRGLAGEPSAVERVADEYLVVGKELQSAPVVPLYEKPTQLIRSVLNGRVPAIKFETADDDVTIATDDLPAPQVAPAQLPMYGAIEGRVQTLSNRGGLRFSLYDLLYNKAVSCYLTEGNEETMRDAWGRVALVEGLVKRDPGTGRPTVVRQVSRVTIRPEALPEAWRDVEGVLSKWADEPAEVTIRRLRDAE